MRLGQEAPLEMKEEIGSNHFQQAHEAPSFGIHGRHAIASRERESPVSEAGFYRRHLQARRTPRRRRDLLTQLGRARSAIILPCGGSWSCPRTGHSFQGSCLGCSVAGGRAEPRGPAIKFTFHHRQTGRRDGCVSAPCSLFLPAHGRPHSHFPHAPRHPRAFTCTHTHAQAHTHAHL